MKRTLKANRRGYTLVEVLSAMTLFAIGAAGVIGMQRTTILGGDDARKMDLATNIAHEWMARFHRDAAFWTKPSPSDASNNNINETKWIAKADGVASTDWLTPAFDNAKPEGNSPFFDFFGRDRPAGSDHVFCTQYRLSWISPIGTAPKLRLTSQIRIDVRVFWARLDNGIVGNCAAPPVAPSDPAAKQYYHFVYAATAVRPNSIDPVP